MYHYNKSHILMHQVCFFVYLKIPMEANHCDEIEILISVMVFCYNKTVPHYKKYFTHFSLIVLSLKLILPEDYYEFLSEIMFLHVYSQHFCCIQSNGKLFFHHLYTHIDNEHTGNYSIRETLRAITRYLSSADTHLPLSPTDYTYPPPYRPQINCLPNNILHSFIEMGTKNIPTYLLPCILSFVFLAFIVTVLLQHIVIFIHPHKILHLAPFRTFIVIIFVSNIKKSYKLPIHIHLSLPICQHSLNIWCITWASTIYAYRTSTSSEPEHQPIRTSLHHPPTPSHQPLLATSLITYVANCNISSSTDTSNSTTSPRRSCHPGTIIQHYTTLGNLCTISPIASPAH